MVPIEVRIVLAIFISYRVAELIAIDDGPFKIFSRFRRFMGMKSTESSLFHEIAILINCPFCIGVWLSALFSILIFFPSNVGDIVLIIGAIAGGQTFLESCSKRAE